MKKEEFSGNIDKVFEEDLINNKMCFQFFDNFPFMIEIFSLDGTSVYVNKLACEEMNVANPDEVVGKYNIINDPVVNDVLGLREDLKKSFEGAHFVSEIRIPYEDINTRYTKKEENFDTVKFQKVRSFQLLDENDKIKYIVLMFETTNTYKEKNGIVKVKKHMNENWIEPYDVDKLAKISGFSIHHFPKAFKQKVGKTPYDYYRQLKIDKLKEQLCDPSITIEQAFDKCKINYNHRNLQLFSKQVGLTPIEYKKEKQRKK